MSFQEKVSKKEIACVIILAFVCVAAAIYITEATPSKGGYIFSTNVTATPLPDVHKIALHKTDILPCRVEITVGNQTESLVLDSYYYVETKNAYQTGDLMAITVYDAITGAFIISDTACVPNTEQLMGVGSTGLSIGGGGGVI